MNFTSHLKRSGSCALRYLSVKVLLTLALCMATSSLVAAQAKHSTAANAKRAFSVPCSQALKIGLDEVEKLYDKDQARRFKGDTDSGTEGDATRAALRNYISCRRNDNLARLKPLSPSARTALVTHTASARLLAQTRFQLILGITFDEHSEDPLNYAMTQRALALIEDYRGDLITVFSHNEPQPVAAQKAAARDNQSIEKLLAKLESKAAEADDAKDYRLKLDSLKEAIANQTANADAAASEKAATSRFILALIKLGLPG